MRKLAIVACLVVFVSRPALAWNEKGHMVVARLAWLKLSPECRKAASEVLRSHPHYAEYLSAECPPGIPVEEWAFLRASYWPDWVRSNHSEAFNQPTWHYVSVAFVPPGSALKAASFPCATPNVVTQIPECEAKIRSGTPQEKAIYLCWLIHLIGDIHQPLHCCSLLNETFPEGDRGGNLSLVRVAGGMPVRLHMMWDDLLGTVASLESIHEAVCQLQQLERSQLEPVAPDTCTTSADWARVGFELAKRHAYLDGDLKPVSADANPPESLVPVVTEAYLRGAETIARGAVIKAGGRLASAVTGALK